MKNQNLVERLVGLLKTVYSHPFNRRRPFFALYRLIRWQWDKRVKSGPIIYEFWNCRKILCFKDATESMWLVYNYIMDWDEFWFIQRYLTSTMCVFDVGCNIGVYTLWISRFIGPEGRIIAFEPSGTAYQRCVQQMRLNHLESVKVEPLAVADREGEAHFSTGMDWNNHLIQDGAMSENFVVVHAVSLDHYCRERNVKKIHFMKIDIEGAEMLAFRGAHQLLSDHLIDVIQFEVTDQLGSFGIQRSQLIQYLESHGYCICSYDLKENRLVPCIDHRSFKQNMYAAHDVDWVNERLQSGVSAH